MERSLAEHRAILTALASRDADHAAALMHAHVNGGLQRAREAYQAADPLEPAGQRSMSPLSAPIDEERA
jgi:DNA-binding GntR family transcriptional regulator